MKSLTFDEPQLVTALQAGDESAFAQIVDAYGGVMRRVALAYVGSDDAAGDVVQDAWLVALGAVSAFRGRSSLKTWLVGIVANVARSHRRKTLRRGVLSTVLAPLAEWRGGPTVDPRRFYGSKGADPGGWSAPPDRWSDRPESQLLAKETLDVVRRAIADLPETQRVVIQMRDVEGFSADEVADALAISPGNQRIRLHRARATVRTRLETYFRGVRP